MSLASWKKEFYKTPASQVSKRFALKHSLRKWIGLQPSNLKKHGIVVNDTGIMNLDDVKIYGSCYDVPFLEIGESSCSLCNNYECDVCPLILVKACCSDNNSPYRHFLLTGKVNRMINALQRAIETTK